MKKADLTISFIPLIIYCGYLAAMQFRVGGDFFIYGLLYSFFGSVCYSIYFVAVVKKTVNVKRRFLFSLSFIFMVCLAVAGYEIGESKDNLLVIGVALYTITAFLLMAVSLSQRGFIARDTNTGDVYQISNGVAYRLSDDDALRYASDKTVRVVDLSSGSFPVVAYGSIAMIGNSGQSTDTLTNPSSGLPMYNGISGLDVGGNTWGSTNIDTGISVNPASGLPMNGGMSGIDVGGNCLGTTSSDYSGGHSSYDPNRGY
ncbi:hypothetical protein ACI2I2_19890 [Scandinavium sp. NPDC088450]|uniref:hypothetical protein n=1 Tax=Scandinavium sp. NPDC088450 TaxID=3364514 RepID=UPI00384F28F5